MIHDFGDGVALKIPEGNNATVLLSYHIDGTDALKGIQRGDLVELMTMSVNQMEELLKAMPRKARRAYVIAIVETIADFSTGIDGLDVVTVKRPKHEEDDDE